MEYPCSIIQDLIPVCLDGTCGPETEASVTAHLQRCRHCQAYFLQLQEESSQMEYDISMLEKWGALWLLKELFGKCRRNWRALLKSFSLLAGCCGLFLALYGTWWYLTQADCIPVTAEEYQVEQVLLLPDDSIFCSYHVRYPSTFTHFYELSGSTVYFTAMRPVLDNICRLPGAYGCWIMNPDSVLDPSSREYVPVDAIFLGNPDHPQDATLIWKRGMELPAASPEDQARINAYDWTIF